MTHPRYVIVSPVRNEGLHIDEVIGAVVSQTVLPTEWIIVDDGSTDETGVIADRWAERVGWLTVVHRPDRGFRVPGTGVMEAFYDGYRRLATTDWDYLSKLDGDIVLAPDYFASCLSRFAADSQIGIGGGAVDTIEGWHRRTEPHPSFHVRGATKIYRRQCWDQIRGLMRATGWDTVDELHAQSLGWRTLTFDSIRVVHKKPTGSADGAWPNAVKNGIANYASAYHPLFMIAKCLRRTVAEPYVLQAAGLAYGYMIGYMKQLPRISDASVVRFVRTQQLRCLTLRSSIWR